MSVLSRACGACARRPQRCRPAALLCAALLLAACGGGGGGGGGAAGGAAASANPGSATNEAQWRTALAALAQAPSPDPVRLEPAALAAYNELVARNWPHLVPRVRRELEAELRAAIGSALGGLQLVSLSGIALDIDAPPALGASAPGLQQTLELLAPAPPHSWSLRLDAVLGGTVPLVIGGVSTQLTVQLAVELEAAQVRVSVPLQFDFSRPQWPELRSLGTPQVQLQLVLRSPDPLLQQLLGTATALLDPVVRAALASAAIYAQYQLGPLALQAMPQGQLWGRGGPPLAPSPGAPDLERLGDAILDEIVRHHLPFGNLYPAVFDTPHQGGNLVGWRHHGDSAMWTGALLGMLAYRWDLSHEQRLMPIAQRHRRGLRRDVARGERRSGPARAHRDAALLAPRSRHPAQ
ncbi:MAG: hypothetical protein KatS3mg102_2742 [Planctomycetota bacterium]|nr:MAG: hypothetical protein KatS3mg102_2742 [Planctomycetota bacterium]